MTIAPGKVRLQIAVPAALKAELDQLAASAGVPTNALAAIFLAQGAAQSRPPDSPVEGTNRQPKGRPTRRKSTPKSEARQEDDDWEDGFTAAEMLAMMPADDRAALLAEGWTEELIDDVLYEHGADDEVGDDDEK